MENENMDNKTVSDVAKNVSEVKKLAESGEKKVAKSGAIKAAGYTSRKAQMKKGGNKTK